MKYLRRERQRLLLSLIALLVVAFFVTTTMSYRVAREAIRKNIIEQQLPLTADSLYSEIQRDLIRPVFVSDQMAHNTFLLDWIADGEQDERAVIRYLTEIKQRYGAVTAFYVSESTRRYFAPDHATRKVLEPAANDAWYFRVRDMHEPFEINIDFDGNFARRLTAFINYRVISADGRYLGATGVGLSSDAIGQLVEQYRTKFGRDIAFYDREGRTALYDPRDPATRTSINDKPGLADLAAQILNNSTRQTSLVYRAPGSATLTHVNSRFIPELNWYLVASLDERESLASIEGVFKLNLAIGTFSTLAALGLALWVVTRYQRRVSHLATTDALTGLANRREGDETLHELYETARTKGTTFSLMLLDADRFKDINDHHGHQVGDRVLEAIAEQIKSQLRGSDTVSRWGGEEFLVLMPASQLEAAQAKAEAIRQMIEAQPFHDHEGRVHHKTISIGVAQWSGRESVDALFRRADQALAQAKQGGRNAVIAASPAAEPSNLVTLRSRFPQQP